ncbi:hypothetical protein HO173_011991 [Letharia columbiana]|uniref:Uncharacterized protein n=1 Tax=Letharia columbiana TaxID=112416 RepID=A0A8H6CQK4_9LECA|nr:uncharacterized protein HO173_011991 [Letharia columbiana]KAF6227773.1 hypothetical protein HO173_011991 [Letharia columbiana]
MAADPTRLSYFSLPGEVRNKIMDHVLVHGDIYPRKPILGTTASIESPPGIQLIATCRQAYLEGHALFYSSNTFHLPPSMTFEWSNRLQAKHKAMIKRIGITLGLVQLTPAMLSQIEFRNCISQEDAIRGPFAVSDFLLDTWNSKLRHVAAWTSLNEIEVDSFGRTYVLRHHEMVANLGQTRVDSWGKLDMWSLGPYWLDTLRRSRFAALGNIYAKVKAVGWKRTKEWLCEEGREDI